MYNEEQLVSFGNYLFEKYGVMKCSADGRGTPLYQRSVADADLANWRHERREQGKPIIFGKGDQVTLSLPVAGGNYAFLDAKVINIHDVGRNTKYDLALVYNGKEHTRVYNIQEDLCLPGWTNNK